MNWSKRIGGVGVGVLALAAWAGPRVDFVREVRPVLERSCQNCHGAKAQMGRLRLDAREAAAKVIRAGKASESELYRRVAGVSEQARMPMGAPPLKAEEIDLLRRWIDEGADWPEAASARGATVRKHWAFAAPVRPLLPAVKRTAWVNNPIDRFVLARLEKEGLAPSPEADRVTLLRRLSLDLTGLPPTIAEVDTFLADTKPGAYERQVERLLASPHYGERWGRHWLDAARYADSDGFEKDKQRQVWFYRDWVIQALNRDLPYNQFVIEQVAGDLLPEASQDQRVATGFLRNSMINEEGGVDPEQFRVEAMFDRMDAIGKSVLGITIQCAQCHNHKYDPLSQEEYYRMFAFLNGAHEAQIAVYTPEEQRKRAQVLNAMRAVEEELKRRNPDWRARMTAWEERVRGDQPAWTVVRPEVDDISTGGQRYLPLEDGSFLAQGYAPTKHTVKLAVRTDLRPITAFRLELLNDPNLPLGGPGRSVKGTAALTEFQVEAAPAAGGKPERVAIARATADVNPAERELDAIYDDRSKRRRVTGPVEYAIDGKEETAWGIDLGPVRRNLPRKAVFEPAEPVGFAGGTILTFHLSQRHGGWNSDDNQNHNLGRFRLSVTTARRPVADPLPQRVREIVERGPNGRSAAEEQEVFRYWMTTVEEWRAETARIEALWREHPEGDSQLVLEAQERPRATHMLVRGDFLKPGPRVEPGTPAFLHPIPAGAASRLDFARWLVDERSPTTARALVNRIWQTYFGTGLVETPEDLGSQSEPPSHPELLDWLAVELPARGWSLKNLHRLIVGSATYRQTSRVTEELARRDPRNRLLARGARFRVEGEIVRDIALAASGLLNRKIGGPSVYAPAPSFLFQPPASYGPKVWREEQGEERYRRALYTFRYRSVPYPVLEAFDAPNGDVACVRRARSNTPLQALATLNEPLFVEAARALGALADKEGGADDSAKLEYAFRRCLARRPTAGEKAELAAFLARQQRQRSREEAWTTVARVLLNLDETITRE